MLLGRCDRDWCEARRIADRVSLRSPAAWPPRSRRRGADRLSVSRRRSLVVSGHLLPPEFYHRGHLPPVTVGVLELGDG